MHPILPVLNLIASAASTAGGVLALTQPGSLSKSTQVTTGELFYARMYAVRAVPLGMVVGLLPFWYQGPVVATVLSTAALVQVADVFIAAGRKDGGMMAGASIATMLHIICACALL